VPPAFVELCESVVLHSDPQRFALLYRLLWRLVHEPALRHDPLDPDMLRARELAKSVHRDIHKMHAFVRFRQVVDGENPLDPLHVAWFEPEHHIVEANAPWFRAASPTCAGRSSRPNAASNGTASSCGSAPARTARTRRPPMRARPCGSRTTATSSIPRA
jgi:hypothetical protein